MEKQTEILQPPALDLDRDLFKREPMPDYAKLERRIVWNLFAHLKAAGFNLIAVHDGEDLTQFSDGKEAMELIFNVGDSRVYFEKNGKKRWVLFVVGNGLDILSDYGSPADGGEGWTAAMDAFDPEVYE